MKKLKYILLFVVLFLVGDVARFVIYPDVALLQNENPIPSAFMQHRVEEWKEHNKSTTLHQTWVKLGNISPFVLKAVLISEDDKFWEHEGFDAEALESAFEKNLKSGKFAFGGSTISQQLSKNLYLSPSKNPIRKIKEAILTWRIEKTLSKKRILEIYLNIAEWGDGIFGIEAASRHYFKKSAKNLTAMQAAQLAAVLPNPIVYNPIGNQKFVVKKSQRIYKIMLKRGIVIPEYKEIMEEKALPAVEVNATQTIQQSDSNESVMTPNEAEPLEDENQSTMH